MRKAETIEKLYLDFDGFFASVMQQAMPHLRGRPVGVIPFETSAANSTVVIACSKEAKAAGCKNVMRVPEARAICPDIILVTQRPDLFRRAHNALLNEIACEIPIETVKSIDELACKLDRANIADPLGLAKKIKDRIRANIGEHITCSIGFAANRLLAKIACKIDKPNGVTIWRPEDMPEPLFVLPLDTIPGVGSRMEERLTSAGIHHDPRSLERAAKTSARPVGQRERRAHVVRASWLRHSRHADGARHVRPWTGFAAAMARRRARAVLFAPVADQSRTAHAPGRLLRRQTLALARYARRRMVRATRSSLRAGRSSLS